jgi:predicted nuclease of restriction endonuclease-like (RecB) superfamily
VKLTKEEKLFSDIKQLVDQSKQFIVQNINTTLVITNYHVGMLIVEDEQRGNERAKYAEKTLSNLSKKLTKEFGKGYSKRNLDLMKQFYLTNKNRIVQSVVAQSGKTKSAISQSKNPKTLIRQSATAKSGVLINTQSVISQFGEKFKLGWTHYIYLMRIENEDERNFYEIEAVNNNWSVRELQRQYNSSLYERIALSKNKKKVKELSTKGQIITQPIDLLKEPYVLEFLELKEESVYTETELETALINKLEHFLLELGKGFLFHSRQQRISFDGDNFYIDLVFYNRILKCFVLIDLKIGELKHQDIGQMQMYVNFYDREIKEKEENKTVGIVLCKQTNKAVVEYTLPKDNNQIFAREYKLYLPSKKQLQDLLLNKI